MATPDFLALPQEMRDEIFSYVLIRKYNVMPMHTYVRRHSYYANDPRISIALFLVNKQISAESQDIFFKRKTFRLDRFDSSIPVCVRRQPGILLAPRLSITIKVCDKNYRQKLKDLKELLDKHMGIKTLHIDFRITNHRRLTCRALPSTKDLSSWFMLHVQDSAVLTTDNRGCSAVVPHWKAPMSKAHKLKWKKIKKDFHELLAELEKSMMRKIDQ